MEDKNKNMEELMERINKRYQHARFVSDLIYQFQLFCMDEIVNGTFDSIEDRNAFEFFYKAIEEYRKRTGDL